jgi:hypothetical protein
MVRAALVLSLLVALTAPATALGAPAPGTTDFGTVSVGARSPVQTVALDGPIAVGHLAIFGTAFRPVTPLSSCERVIPDGAHCTLQLRFAPPVAGDYRGRISADGGAPLALLTGTGALPQQSTGGIGDALEVGRVAPSALPTAFAAHVRWHIAERKHRSRHARRAHRHHHK